MIAQIKFSSIVNSLFFFGLLLFSSTTFAQTGTITGTLLFENGNPVISAVVYIPSLEKHAVSDTKGLYEIQNIPYGTYEVEVRSIEIEKSISTVEVRQPSINFSPILRENSHQLGEVVVKGASEKKLIESKGFAVNVVETAQAAVSNFQTNELLNRTVGVNVRQNGGLGAAVNYNLNGMSGNSVRIFVDDIPISTYGSSFSLNSIPPALIERIEVYKGVIPSHLADDALGGAINVILKKNQRNNLTASLSYGSFNTFQGNFSSMYRNPKSGFTIKASGFHNYSDNDYEVWGKFVRNTLPSGQYEYVRAKRFNDGYRSTGGKVEAGFTHVKWADQFFIGYNGSDDYNEIQHGTYMTVPYAGRFSESQTHALSLNYRKRDIFIRGLEFNFNGVYSQRNEIFNDTVPWLYNWSGEIKLDFHGNPTHRGAQLGSASLKHTDRNVATIRSGVNYSINNNHKITFNYSFFTIDRRERDEMKSKVEQDFIGTRDLQKNILSLSYEMKSFRNRLNTNFFGKYYQQKINRMEPVLEENTRKEEYIQSNKYTTGYGLALSFALLPEVMLLSSAEKAIRMPSENEVFGSVAENIVENVSLQPEISNNLNIGFRAGSYYLHDHRFGFSGNFFVRDTKDKIVQRINPRRNDAVQASPYENMHKTQSIGFEVEANYSFDNKLDFLFNLSKFNTRYNHKYDSNGMILPNYRKQMPNEPYFTANSMLQYSLHHFLQKKSTFNFYYNFRFVESFYTTWDEAEESRTPRQYIQDIGASYLFPNKKFVVSLDMKNIFDKQAYDNFAVQKPGRAFYLKVNYTINNF